MTNRLKVIIINTHPQDALGGSEIQCDIIGNELTKFGHDVTYLAIDGSQTEYDTSYKVISISQKPDLITNTVINENPDLVYWRYNKQNFYKTARLIKKAHIPIIFAVSHVSDVLKWRNIRRKPEGKSYLKHYISNLKKVFLSRWNHKGYQYVDGVTSLNKNYLNKLPVEMQKYIPNSMSLESLDFTWPRPYVFWVANLKAQKRPEDYIEVANHIKSLGVDVVIVGKIQDNNYSYFRNEDNLPDNLYYLGPKTVREVNGMLKSSICLFHTCRPEGFGNNFIQAWLQGRPTVSLEFDPGGLIQELELGFVSDNDINQFIKDITTLIEDRDLNKRMGKNARNYANKHHHPETNVRKLLSFMEELIQINK